MCSQLPSSVYRHTVRIRPLVYKVRLTHNTLAHTHRRTHSRFKFVPFARINCRNFLTSERVPKPCATARRVCRVVADTRIPSSILWRSKHHHRSLQVLFTMPSFWIMFVCVLSSSGSSTRVRLYACEPGLLLNAWHHTSAPSIAQPACLSLRRHLIMRAI